jgi:hypothetical protein
MTTTSTNTASPAKYRKNGACPHCGAPIYADASLMKGKNDDTIAALPLPYYTCGCRFNLQVQPTVYPIPIPTQPDPQMPFWKPQPFQPNTVPWPTSDPHWTICLRPKPSETQCKAPNFVPAPPDFDWRPFTGSGGCGGFPMDNITVLN